MGRPRGSKNGVYTTVERVCETCDRVFQVEPHRSSARFCSRVCKDQGHSLELRTADPRVCACCGVEFIVAPSSQRKYCSRRCSHNDHGRKVRGHRPDTLFETKACLTCGVNFSARVTLGQRFCSRDCANQSFKRRIILICQACGISFEVRAKLRDQKYCSRSCRTIGIGKTESYLERVFAQALTLAGIHANPQFQIGPFTVDFAIPQQSVAVECDGDYWHSLPECRRRDHRKDAYLSARGWTVLRFSETAINADLTHCISQVSATITARSC
jgi:very-short-patch-repair endonuclease